MMNLSNPDLLQNDAFVAGGWHATDQRFAVTNPSTGEVLAQVADCSRADAKRAIASAGAAQKAWAARTAKDRAQILRRWFDLIQANSDSLATILTAEMGKPLAEAKSEILYGASFIEWFAEEAKRVYGETIPGHQTDKRLLVMHQPVGVVGAITPWNFPNAMVTRKVAPALAAGCAIIVKPACETPLSALALARLAEQAGVPPGVLSVLPSSDSSGMGLEFCENPAVRKISFTGSTKVGRILMRQGADQIKKLSLELGGNAPFIVFDDADLDAAVEGAVVSKFRNAGQTCVCTNRIYVQDSVYEAFTEKLTHAVAGLNVGDGFAGDAVIGPLISKAALDKVREHIGDATRRGARVTIGGDLHGLGGTFFQPTVLRDVTADMAVAREETFGPLAPVFRFSTLDEVVDAANRTEFGLASYVYSRDIGRIWQMMERLECGMVGVNTGLISTEAAPFGGIKQSGLGREGSRHGLSDYMDLKYCCLSI